MFKSVGDEEWLRNLISDGEKKTIIVTREPTLPSIPKKPVEEETDFEKETIMALNFDLHGFTCIGASQFARKTTKMLDDKMKYKLTFTIGVGNHSKSEPVLYKSVSDAIKNSGIDAVDAEIRNPGRLVYNVNTAVAKSPKSNSLIGTVK